MKFIDGNGRLFGKINIIDFLLISLLLFLLPMFYFGYQLAKTHSDLAENNDKIVIPFDMYVCFKNVNPDKINLIKVGDKGRNIQGNIVVEILEICRVTTNFVEIRLSETEAITKADNQRKQITLKIRLWATLTNSDILYEGRYLRVGSDFVFATDKYQLRGIIQPLSSQYEDNDQMVLPINLSALFENLSPEVANLISTGDFELDKNGNTVAKILSVGAIEPYTYTIDLGGGNYVTKVDPQKKQVQAKMEILGNVDGTTFYFKGERIAMDSRFSLNTNKYSVGGKVIGDPVMLKASVKVPINIDLILENLSPEVANLISTGDFELDKNGNTVAKILSVGAIEPYTYTIDLGGGNYVTKVDPQKKQVQAKMEILGSVQGSAFYFKGERIAMDSKVVFTTNIANNTLEGKIIRDPSTPKLVERKWMLVKTKFKNLPAEVVDTVKENDAEKNISGDVIAKISSICSTSPAETFIPNLDGDKLVFTKEENKDVVALLKLHCVKAREGLSFKEIIVRLNTTIPFQTDKYSIAGRIIEINEVANE